VDWLKFRKFDRLPKSIKKGAQVVDWLKFRKFDRADYRRFNPDKLWIG